MVGIHLHVALNTAGLLSFFALRVSLYSSPSLTAISSAVMSAFELSTFNMDRFLRPIFDADLLGFAVSAPHDAEGHLWRATPDRLQCCQRREFQRRSFLTRCYHLNSR
jgi:hypothetical protein